MAKKNLEARTGLPKPNEQKAVHIDFDFEDLVAAAVVSVIIKRPKKTQIYLQTLVVVNSRPLSLNPPLTAVTSLSYLSAGSGTAMIAGVCKIAGQADVQ